MLEVLRHDEVREAAMTMQSTGHEERELLAMHAIDRLPHGGRDRVVLQVQCSRSHHLAKVFDTDAGFAYQSTLRGHAHGHRDRIDDPHGAGDIHHWSDLLDADPADDALPASCECGQRMLSRAALRRWIGDGEQRVVVD